MDTNLCNRVGVGEPSWHVYTFPLAPCAQVRMSDGLYTHVC